MWVSVLTNKQTNLIIKQERKDISTFKIFKVMKKKTSQDMFKDKKQTLCVMKRKKKQQLKKKKNKKDFFRENRAVIAR